MIDLYASLSHYAEHLWPIWRELQRRGLARHAWAPGDQWWGRAVPPRWTGDDLAAPLLVAAFCDAQAMVNRSLLYLEHGAGQSYDGDERSRAYGSYSGGHGLERALLFIAPSERVAQRWRDRYPQTRAQAVGSPRLDVWHAARVRAGRVGDHALSGEERGRTSDSVGDSTLSRTGSTIAVTFHWDCGLIPETQSAWGDYDSELPALVSWAREHDVLLLGHGHPRIWSRIRRRWQQLGVECVPDSADVLDRADLLVVDNSSLMYEAASLGISIVALNARRYRREVDHGMRFWDLVPGPQVDRPSDLVSTVESQLSEPSHWRERREDVVRQVYAYCDGRAAERAADAIEDLLASR